MKIVPFAMVVFFWSVAIANASNMRLVSGGRQLPDEFSPVHTATGFVVPLDLAALFGGTVEREGDEWVVYRGRQSARFRPGAPEAVVGDKRQPLPSAPIPLDDQLYVPLRFLGDFLGLRISVSGNTLDVAPWSSLTVNRNGAQQASTSVGLSEDVRLPETSRFSEAPLGLQPVPVQPVPTPGGINAFLIGPPVLEGPKTPGEEVGSHEQAGPAVDGDQLAQTVGIGVRVPGAGAAGTAYSSQSTGSSQGVRPSSLEERLRTVNEAIARLLNSLEMNSEKSTDVEWTALRQQTGLALQVLEEGGFRRYHFQGDAHGAASALLVDPPRLVVDFPNVRGTRLDPFVPSDPVVQRIRAVDWEGSLRLVFDLAFEVGHRLSTDSEGANLVLFRPLTQLEVDADRFGGRIRLDVSGHTPYKISRLVDPDRVVVDLLDTTLVAGPVTIGPLAGPVSQVRAAQFQPDVTRIVLDVAGETPVEVVSGSEALTLTYGDQRGTIAYRIPGEREFHVAVAAPADARVSVYRLSHPDRLVMDVSGMRLEAPLQDALFLEGPVSRLRASQYDETTVRIVADLRFHVRYTVKDEGDRRVLVMEQPLLARRTLTVDAGHGGHDGGAVGVRLGVLEKEINLDIARRLERLLIGAEATVHMTRADDRFVDLWARADLANETQSDVLVSIHANSAPDNTTAKGTETFVRTGEPDSERLGAALQRSLTSALGTIDRGVRPNRYLVVRRAQMPAALVEVAFLADPEEEALLMEEWFRERAAQGIFNGLLRYFYPQDELESDWAGASTREVPWHRLPEAGDLDRTGDAVSS